MGFVDASVVALKRAVVSFTIVGLQRSASLMPAGRANQGSGSKCVDQTVRDEVARVHEALLGAAALRAQQVADHLILLTFSSISSDFR